MEEVRVNGSKVITNDHLPITIKPLCVLDYKTFVFRYDGPWKGSILLDFLAAGRDWEKLVDLQTASSNPIEGAYPDRFELLSIYFNRNLGEIARYMEAVCWGSTAAKESDMEKTAKATGARIATSLDDITHADLGQAGMVEERKIGEDKWVFIEECKNPKSVTILIRGGTEKFVDEAERAVHDALMVIKDVVTYPYIVAGGGAPEVEVALRLNKFAEKISGKQQLAIKKFAEASEIIASCLAENTGLDPIDILTELRHRHETGEVWAGVDVHGRKTTDMYTLISRIE